MKIEIVSNYGNFATRLTAEVPEGGNATLYKEGLSNLLFRLCSSAVDKVLKVKGAKADKTKGEWVKRVEVEYSEANARKVMEAVEKVMEELRAMDDPEGADYKALGMEFAVTGEHQFGEQGSAMVRATTLVDAMLADAEMEKAYRMLFKLQGLENAETVDRAGLIAFCHGKGLGVQPAKK